eukprot:10740798-Alexandrium_andersonii.AAC.1
MGELVATGVATVFHLAENPLVVEVPCRVSHLSLDVNWAEVRHGVQLGASKPSDGRTASLWPWVDRAL